MTFKVTRLDRRHNCHGIMKYHVEVTFDIWGSDNRISKFKELREWCWDQFGPGTESKWIVVHPVDAGPNGECRMEARERWAWQTEFNEMRIYFKSDAELSWFKLNEPILTK